MRAQIVSVGMAVPDKVETSAELVERIGRPESWILSRTGVARRRIAEQPIEQLAAAAAQRAIGEGPPPDLIVNASTTPRQAIPDSSVFVQQALGYSGIPSFTIHATCLSFIVAVQSAAALLSSRTYRRVLVVSAEIGSLSRNFEEAESAALLGDGAAAAIIERTPQGQISEVLAYKMATWPEGAGLTELRGFGTRCHPDAEHTTRYDNYFSMNGPAVLRMAFQKAGLFLEELFEQAQMSYSDVDLVVPHQASRPALIALASLGFAEEKIVDILADYGNCVAASIPMALTVALEQGRLHRGDRVLLAGTGAGLSGAGMILIW